MFKVRFGFEGDWTSTMEFPFGFLGGWNWQVFFANFTYWQIHVIVESIERRMSMFSTIVVSLVLAAAVNPWEKASSIPVPATLDPVVSDRTSPVTPTAVEVSGLLGERIHAHTFGRIMTIDEDVLLDGFRSRPGSHPWIGEHVGKWLHAASLLWLSSQEPALREKIMRVAKGIRPGMRFLVRFDPMEAIAIRIIGKPASGDNLAQAFASCAELMGFEE